jgi:hypothetical protein
VLKKELFCEKSCDVIKIMFYYKIWIFYTYLFLGMNNDFFTSNILQINGNIPGITGTLLWVVSEEAKTIPLPPPPPPPPTRNKLC